MSTTKALAGKVALVSGASRGAGRAIARELGRAGATVVVTGRSSREGARTEDRRETIEDTAEQVSSLGGVGLPVRCDHGSESEVRALFERVGRELGRLDVLVNNAWGGYEGYDHESFQARFWRQPFDQRWTGMFEHGVRAQLMTTHYAVPLMIPQKAGLIAGTIAWVGGQYLGNLYYDVAKAALVRFAFGLSHELHVHGIAAVALIPGFMRTERVLDKIGGVPEILAGTESPEYVARAVAALASDPRVFDKSGKALVVADLAAEYGFTDVDGRRVPEFRFSWVECAACHGTGADPTTGAECGACHGLGKTTKH